MIGFIYVMHVERLYVESVQIMQGFSIVVIFGVIGVMINWKLSLIMVESIYSRRS